MEEEFRLHAAKETLSGFISHDTDFDVHILSRYKDRVELIVKAVNHHDELVEALKGATCMIGSLRRLISRHADFEEGSEFENYVQTAQETEDPIEELLSKIEK